MLERTMEVTGLKAKSLFIFQACQTKNNAIGCSMSLQ